MERNAVHGLLERFRTRLLGRVAREVDLQLATPDGNIRHLTPSANVACVTVGSEEMPSGADHLHLRVRDPLVSGLHCRMVRSVMGCWRLEDLDSLNGTILDRVWVTRPAPLREGSRIRVGNTRLIVSFR